MLEEKCFENMGESERKMGRPRLRWLEEAKNKLQGLRAESWGRGAKYREKLTLVLKEANVHRGSQSQAVTKLR
jgi:hypothetical protein